MDIFSKIAAGEIPSWKCAANEKFYAFLDINPLVKGHTLVIPRREVDYYFDMTDEEIAEKKKREEERRRKEEERKKREEEKKKKKPSIFAKWTKTIENKLGSTCDNILNMMDDDESNEQ